MNVDSEKIVKKMIYEIAENNEKILHTKNIENFKRIVPVLMEKGIENVNLSMFDDHTKSELFNALGEEYLRKGNLNEAIKSYILAGNKQRLTEVGQHYEEVGLFSNAIDTYRLADAKDQLLKDANKSHDNSHFSEAIKASNHF